MGTGYCGNNDRELEKVSYGRETSPSLYQRQRVCLNLGNRTIIDFPQLHQPILIDLMAATPRNSTLAAHFLPPSAKNPPLLLSRRDTHCKNGAE